MDIQEFAKQLSDATKDMSEEQRANVRAMFTKVADQLDRPLDSTVAHTYCSGSLCARLAQSRSILSHCSCVSTTSFSRRRRTLPSPVTALIIHSASVRPSGTAARSRYSPCLFITSSSLIAPPQPLHGRHGQRARAYHTEYIIFFLPIFCNGYSPPLRSNMAEYAFRVAFYAAQHGYLRRALSNISDYY